MFAESLGIEVDARAILGPQRIRVRTLEGQTRPP